ncbi:tRNA (5-methylaminomethyl-2-thiouridylate)-methyltransferase [Caldimicrobium thiodismutans]|uniref:tRNA-specific 2-thiouridylase MnmA n=1 Tax=Caldimicrobium thiodismutans TaxID=1653476 RepID=A0A0U5AKD0_9BACT|nr:tRNA 2-thiouridine(34) synthase MnmA [Caldimicrobium thiodismutans]BAU22548.1 tRNA (5-methylaminomethyl-2-thiouridylate)-methyltransferase [Caldimicrobium thiodismutans]
MKVAVAMSGGVDSSVSALLLKKRGFEVIGISFLLFDNQEKSLEEAMKVAEALEIPHYFFDLREVFKREIIESFINEYSLGRTPNPCALCNRKIKFGLVLELVKRDLGVDFYATGHYVEKGFYKSYPLLKISRNRKKDQSYFLSLIPGERIPELLFPVGEFESKDEVRNLAEREGLKFWKKEESQEVCFFMGKSLVEYLEEHLGEREGEIIYQGRVVGKHKGIHFYTIGQRRGFNLPFGKPLYVVKIEAKTNRIHLGEERELEREEFYLEDINFQLPLEYWESPRAQIRYRTEKVPVKEIKREGEFWKIILKKPVKRVTPGQVCAFYEGEFLLGGGVIAKTD